MLRRSSRILLLTALAAALAAPAAHASYPYRPQGAPGDYGAYRLPSGSGQTPDDLTGKLTWMYASTPDPNADPATLSDPRELDGVRGAHLADPADVPQGWRI